MDINMLDDSLVNNLTLNNLTDTPGEIILVHPNVEQLIFTNKNSITGLSFTALHIVVTSDNYIKRAIKKEAND